MGSTFPTTNVGGIKISRMIIGTNWMNGYSHRTDAADQKIKDFNVLDRSNAANMIKVFMDAGVNAVLGGIGPFMYDAIHQAEDMAGKKLYIINTPHFDTSDTKEARRSAELAFDEDKRNGVTFCWPFHAMVEELVCKRTRSLPRLPDYLQMIRERDMIPGLSLHMHEIMTFCDEQDYDVEGYIQIYNCLGFMMQMEVETVNQMIWNAKKPVLTIKPMAAGRCTPLVGLNFVWNTIREKDMVAVGCMTPQEAEEVVEYSHAALERRQIQLKGRGSLGNEDDRH